MQNKIKPIAIHLPQFHPFPENDRWWGKGFTEWTNVTKAKPLFEGHYQPHLPADLGFYDLRLEEARMAQIALAKEYGIFGFCYYHYWFNGKRLMHEPLDRMLANEKEDFPFMLCWANENWTRRWDGQENEILIKQDYNDKDNKYHICFLIKNFFNDHRYIKIKGKPFFIFYKPQEIPNLKELIVTWRAEAKKQNLELYLGYMKQCGVEIDLETYNLDCAIEFQPNFGNLPRQDFAPIQDKIKTKLGINVSPYYTHHISSYSRLVDHMTKNFSKALNTYPGITPGWDNTARKSRNGLLFKGSTPSEYGRWLKFLNEKYSNENTFLFINAWNEWAEGNHLEPCRKWGLQYLETTKQILNNA